MDRKKGENLRAKLDKVKIEPEELQQLSHNTSSKLSQFATEIRKTLDEDEKV